jgi:hypothetical protein
LALGGEAPLAATGSAAEGGEVTMTYTFNNTRPIELLDLTASLLAIGDQYRRFASDHFEGGDDYRLYVREARTGSIIIDLITYATQPQMLAPLTPVLIDFTTELGEWFDFFKGVKDAKDIKDLLTGKSKKDLQQLSDIIEPAARDTGSRINITAERGAVIVLNSTITSTEANAGQNVLRRYIDHIPLPTTGVHRDQVLYWYQMRHDHAAKPGDKAVIERIWEKPVKVRITSDEVKRKMLDDADNPFKKFYVVDVDVTESQNRPVLYKILEVKDSFDRDDGVE